MDVIDRHIRILNLEDSAIDADLIVRELTRAHLDFSATRTESEAAFRAAIETSEPDVILADYNLSGFDGVEALKIARALAPRTPFIFVSGSIGEERALQALREGATDYVIKDRLSRLPAAITRALADKAELELFQRLSRQNEMILNFAAEGIFGVDRSRRVIFANPAGAALSGWSVEEITATSDLHSLIHHTRSDGKPYPIEECPFYQSMVDGRVRSGEETFWRKSGEPFPVQFTCSPMFEQSQIIGAVAIIEDVTERNRLKKQLEQANRVSGLGRVAATMAHEFNNVLMGIQPFAELIRGRSDDEKTRKAAVQIGISVARGKRVTQEILRFTQPGEPDLKPIAIGEWLDQLLPELKSLVGPDVELVLRFPPEPVVVRGDTAQLQQVLTNLILNGRDAMSGKGVITIAVHIDASDHGVSADSMDPGMAVITVRDTGGGMTPEVLQCIFEPLFTTKRTGTGLGLAVAQQMIQRHAGSIHAESKPGEGTTFFILIPTTLSETPAPAAMARESKKTRVTRVVVVEDEPAVAAGIVLLLDLEGVEARVAERGGEALEVIEAFEPDAVVIDMSLSDMKGVQVYELIAALRPRLPVLFSSGDSDESSVERYFSSGHVAFLRKPYELSELMEALERITRISISALSPAIEHQRRAMPLNWAAVRKSDDVRGFIAAGKYERALDVLEGQLRQDPKSVHLLQSVADAMVMAGRKEEAVQILLGLSDDFSRAGFAAKAIAVLKKIDRLLPGGIDVYRRLADELPKRAELEKTSGHGSASAHGALVREPAPATMSIAEDVFKDYMSRESEWSAQRILLDPDRGLYRAPGNTTTPLFESLTSEELLPLLLGLKLVTYEAGDVVVAEGEPGHDLFILTSGRVKTFVRDSVGHLENIRELTDGDFFGEIAFLRSTPRTATITAAGRCEILVLDHATLVDLCESHPHVREVLDRFSAERDNSAVEVQVRKSGGPSRGA